MKANIQDIELTVAQEQPSDEQAMQLDLSLVQHLEVQLNANIGSTKLSVESLAKLKVGEILALNETVDKPIELELNGVVVAEGMLVAQDGKYGVKLTKLMNMFG